MLKPFDLQALSIFLCIKVALVTDPTCGSAGMLISSIAWIREHGQEYRNVHVYGQEINDLTSAIGRMNLFLHGISDFQIVTGDTLKAPAFVEGGRVQQFDLVLANPPYSIKQWDRTAFENDKYGRNFLGTPPQGRADYAFFQHILKSMKPVTGRCAILFPHGVLFREEESTLRENLVKSDLIECVIGLGPNLFFNAPMEACIVICRTLKPAARKHKVLFINAVDEVTRKNAQSYLEDEHIAHIAGAYLSGADEEGYSRLVDDEEITGNRFNLSIPLYVRKKGMEPVPLNLQECLDSWQENAALMHSALETVVSMIEEDGGETDE